MGSALLISYIKNDYYQSITFTYAYAIIKTSAPKPPESRQIDLIEIKIEI